MPCFIRILTPNGLELPDYIAESLADAATYEPRDGVYTVANTFETFKVLKLDAHLDRLENSARLASIDLKLERTRLRVALRTMISEAGYGDVRYRVTVPKDMPNRLILSIEPFKPLAPEIYTQGVKVVTSPGSARHDPAAKTTDWMHDRKAIDAALPQGTYTALLLSRSGDILEGVSSNFYAVLNDELRTAGEGVLPGIAQQVVFTVAPAVVTVIRQAVNVRDLPTLQEAFITSSSRGIVPVVEIDHQPIGSGVPGVKTKALRVAYNEWVSAHLEEL